MAKFPRRENMHEGDGQGGGNFLKIKDGESVVGVLVGDIYRFHQKGFGKTQEIVGPDDPSGKERYRHNIAVKEDGKFVAKIWEFGPKIYDSLYALEDGGWDLATTTLVISRTGSTKENTRYTVTPQKAPPSAASMKEISALELNKLEHFNGPKSETQTGELPF